VPVETHFTAFYTNGATSKPRREEEQIILWLRFRSTDDKRKIEYWKNLFPMISDGKFYNINSSTEAGKGKI
jgi:hypothetical protein